MPKQLERRSFLLRSAALASAGLLPAAARAQTPLSRPTTVEHHPNFELCAQLVLPAQTLGRDSLTKTLGGFKDWLTAFEPVAELDHGYLSSDAITYGPPDPRPLWLSQLEALDIEAGKRYSAAFEKLSKQRQQALLQSAMDRASAQQHSLPRPEHAPHIAIAMMAWYFRSSAANDLCYQARIGRHECRGMARVIDKPRPLPNAERSQ